MIHLLPLLIAVGCDLDGNTLPLHDAPPAAVDDKGVSGGPPGGGVRLRAVGDTSSSWSAGPYFRGNAYAVDADSQLRSFAVYLGLESDCDVDFYVHQRAGGGGAWTTVWAGTKAAPAGTGHVRSPAVELDLVAGDEYGLGVGWNCTATYYGDSYAGAGAEAGVGEHVENYWDNSYPGFSATYTPPEIGSEALAYYHRIAYRD